MQIAHSLETDSLLIALRRFIGRRGQVREIRSDNGTNFTGGERELRESINAWNHSKIHEALLQKNTKWIFNPKSVKFRRRLGKLYSHVLKPGFFVATQVETRTISCRNFLETMVWRISAPASEQTKMDIAL